MTGKTRVAGYLLMLLAVCLQDWTPLLVFILAMLCGEHLQGRGRLEQGRDAEAG